eukprot:765701-Hanusia_phi.AAC.1
MKSSRKKIKETEKGSDSHVIEMEFQRLVEHPNPRSWYCISERRWQERKSKRKQKLYDEMSKLSKKLQESQKLRQIIFTRNRRCYGEMTSQKFAQLVSQRDFKGECRFDHKAQEMTPVVRTECPEGDGGEMDAVEIRNLSGGERSFATICLVQDGESWSEFDSCVRSSASTKSTVLQSSQSTSGMCSWTSATVGCPWTSYSRSPPLLLLLYIRIRPFPLAVGNLGLTLVRQVLSRRPLSQAIIISPHSVDAVADGPRVKKITMRPIDRLQRRMDDAGRL